MPLSPFAINPHIIGSFQSVFFTLEPPKIIGKFKRAQLNSLSQAVPSQEISQKSESPLQRISPAIQTQQLFQYPYNKVLNIIQMSATPIGNVQNIETSTTQQRQAETITEYMALFLSNMRNVEVLPQIKTLQTAITNDPLLRMHLEAALKEIPNRVPSIDYSTGDRPAMLYGCSVSQMCMLLNVAIQTPPSFLPSDYVGTPFSVVLIDIMNTQHGKAVFARTDFNALLRPLLDKYGEILKSERSLEYFHKGQGGLFSEKIMALVNYDDFICDRNDPYLGFKSWNDWFTRDLAPNARPVYGEDDPNIIVHAAQNNPLTTIDLPATNVKAVDQFWLKENRYSLYDMFDAGRQGLKEMVDEYFVGGTVYQGYLNPWCYHQWHAPVSGVIEHSYRIDGAYFLQNPSLQLDQANNYDNSQTFLSCTATRHVFIINTRNSALGRVALIAVGMVEVSSCIPAVSQGDTITKGQCIGRFEMGGSSHVLVFERKARLQFSGGIFEREVVNGYRRATRQRVNSFLARVIS